MSVLTPAHTPAAIRLEVHYRDLDALQRDTWHTAQEKITQATTAHDIVVIHALTAAALGIHLPDGAELTECSCEPCPDGCDLIYEASTGATWLDGTIERPQCPACAEDHRHTGQ